MYINLSTGNTLLWIFVKLVFMYMYICIIIIVLWTCHLQTFYKFRTPRKKNSSPIVLIKIPTIVLKEGRSERGYNPEILNYFWNNPKDSTIGWHVHLSQDWLGLPSGEAALASPIWQTPSNSSLDWARCWGNTQVRLGESGWDQHWGNTGSRLSEISRLGLGWSVLGITLGQGSWHLSRTSPGGVLGRPMLRGNRRLRLGHM